MNNDLDAIAKRANIAVADRPGFCGCAVESEMPPILAYQFNTALEAEQFKLTQSTQAPQFTYAIPPNRLETVLEYR